MQRYEIPTLKCGRILKFNLPRKLSKEDTPINLASVKVDVPNMKEPCILINYSQNFAFSFFDNNPTISIVYRLIRKSKYTENTILDEWNYRVSEVIPTTVEDVNTIEPLVLNFCDCICNAQYESRTYIVQITELITENTTLEILNQEISGIVSCKE